MCVLVCVVAYLSGHVGRQRDPGPEGRVDPEEHHPEPDAAPDGDVAELGRGGVQRHSERLPLVPGPQGYRGETCGPSAILY